MTRLWAGALAALCLAALAASLFWMGPGAAGAQNAQAVPESWGVLRDFGGRLALFAPGGGEPLEVYEIYTRLLPPVDAEALAAGIPVGSEAELDRLLEDFGA